MDIKPYAQLFYGWEIPQYPKKRERLQEKGYFSQEENLVPSPLVIGYIKEPDKVKPAVIGILLAEAQHDNKTPFFNFFHITNFDYPKLHNNMLKYTDLLKEICEIPIDQIPPRFILICGLR